MKEKKLLIVSTNFPPDARAGTQRIIRFTKYLVKLGWNISVLTPKPEFSLYKTVQDESLLAKVPASVKIYRTRVLRLSWPLSGLNSYLIPDREVGWVPIAYREGLKIINAKGISCLYSSAPPWSAHLICWFLKKKTGIKWVADIRDPWTRRPWMSPEDRKGVRYAALRKIERTIVRSADRIILNTPSLHREFCSYYQNVEQSKFVTITNGIDGDDFLGLNGSNKPRSGPFLITHGGSLYRKRDPRPLLQAISKLVKGKAVSQTEVLVRFVGSVDPKFDMCGWIHELGLGEVVTVEPPVPHEQYLQLLSSSDLLLLLQPDTDLQVPSKLFEYMAVGKPILALAHQGATADIVRQYDRGKIVEPYDVNEIEKAIVEFIRFYPPTDENPIGAVKRESLKFSAANLSQELDRTLAGCLAE